MNVYKTSGLKNSRIDVADALQMYATWKHGTIGFILSTISSSSRS